MIRNRILISIIVFLIIFFVHLDVNATDFRCTVQDINLPSPGMLSNHPLYVLKKVRDKILEQFILEPNKRMEYYLFESRKLLNESLIHFNNGRLEMGDDAGRRSNNFLTLFIPLYGQTANNGKPIQKKFMCDFYSIVALQMNQYDGIIATMNDGDQKTQLIQIVDQIKQNKEGFDNLLTTMNAKRIIYE